MKSFKNILINTTLSAFAAILLSGCLEERAIPGDELVTIYNSNLEKTNKMHPLDTMYAEINGLKENSSYQIRVLDSDKNEITIADMKTDENGSSSLMPIWYDIGLVKPTEANPYFHIKKDPSLDIKSFYINIIDKDTNGNDTNFYQPFFYVSSTDAKSAVYPKPVIYASNSKGIIENAFEETGSKDINGEDSLLTKVYLKVQELPTKDYLTNKDISLVDVYVIPFKGYIPSDINITKLNPTITLNDINVTELESESGQLIWDLNDVNNSLVNPDDNNTAYSVILDLNRDGIFNVGKDIDGDGVTDRYIDAADGKDVPGFIIQNTHANELSYSLTNSAGDKITAVPECINNKGGSVFINIDNIATESIYLNIDVNGSEQSVYLSEPTGDDGRYLKYIQREMIFDSCNPEVNVDDGEIATIKVDVNMPNSSDDINETIKVYSVLTNIVTTNGETNTTLFDETGTVEGDTKIYLKSDTNYSANIYLFDGNITDFNVGNSLASKSDVNLRDDGNVEIFDLDSDIEIINPKENNGMYKIFIDSKDEGVSDKNLIISIRDTFANDAPDVGYINIASKGMDYYEFDNHYSENDNMTVYGYVDQFNKYGNGVKVIWNPYIKNRAKEGGFYGNYYRQDSSLSTYTNYDGTQEESPFAFGQRVAIYIIDADEYKLEANMNLDGKDIRDGYGTILPVQYSCSNGWMQQSIWRSNMVVGKYYLILDTNLDGKLTEGIDYVDAVNEQGVTIKEDSSIVGFSVTE